MVHYLWGLKNQINRVYKVLKTWLSKYDSFVSNLNLFVQRPHLTKFSFAYLEDLTCLKFSLSISKSLPETQGMIHFGQ